jgi:Dolichyl-phosphate-mannose-protein mannosyltransferase
MTTHEDVTRAPAATSPARRVAWHLERAALPLVAALAFLVHLPVLSTPLFLDDYNQIAMVEGRYPSHPGPFDLYDFINDANRVPLIERGILPWWSHPRMELRFLRPLSSALLWADHRIFGAGGLLFQHLNSLFWLSLASVGVYKLLRQLFARRVATIGVLVFAVAPCHGCPLSWIANREELVSVALGTFALFAYSRWRERGPLRDALVSFALFVCAMLAGEYSLCFAGYVLAIEVTRPRSEPLSRRLLGVSPFAAPVLAYLATRHSLHYGAFGTGYYHDPLRDFGSYAADVPGRFAILFATAWGGVDDRIWVNERGWKLGLLLAATLALVALPVRSLLGSLDGVRRRRAIWLLAGSILALAPIMAVGPSVRLLEIPMLGVSAIVALVLDQAWFPPRPQPRHGIAEWTSLFALGLAFAHLVRAPLDSWITHREVRRIAGNFEREMAWLHDHAAGKSMVVILRANWFQTMFVAPLMIEGTAPVRCLSYDSGRSLLLRTGLNSLELVAGTQALFPVGDEDLVRNRDVPLVVDDTVELSGMRATVVALRDDGKPRRVRFDFDHDLDDPSYLWVLEKGVTFEEQKLPAPGFGEPLKM